MKRVVRKIVYSAIIAFITGALLNLCLYLWILGEYAPEICFSTNIANVINGHKIDVLFSGWLFASLSIIIQLWSYLSQQLNTPLHSIPSDIIRKQAHTFGEIDVTKICRRLTALETGIHSILWEFDGINDFNDFEKRCLICDPANVDTIHNCNAIKEAVKIKRRHRITDIANCLVFNKWKINFLLNNVFFATETRRPSEIVDKDKYYYQKQKNELKSRNVDKAQRLLILSRSNLQDEITNHNNKVSDFIKLNTEANDKQKKLTLKIITYTNNISDVFAKFGIDRKLYDFVISKKESKVFKNKKLISKKTVFAQNTDDKLLRSFDSTREIDKFDIEKFLTAFDDLYNAAASVDATTDDIRFSAEINNINDIKTHMYQ